jgi:hypothetical protein
MRRADLTHLSSLCDVEVVGGGCERSVPCPDWESTDEGSSEQVSIHPADSTSGDIVHLCEMQSLFMGHFLNRLQVLEAAPGCLAKTAEHQLPDNEWMSQDEVILKQ